MKEYSTGKTVDIIEKCLEEMAENHSREDRHTFMLEKVRRCVKNLYRTDKNGRPRMEYNWTIGNFPEPTISGLCRSCFAVCYDCSHSLVDACCKEIQPRNAKRVVTYDLVLNDRTAVNKTNKDLIKGLKMLVESGGNNLTLEQEAMLFLPNSVESCDCYA